QPQHINGGEKGIYVIMYPPTETVSEGLTRWLSNLENEEISGSNFLDMTKQDFQDYGMKGGPAITLAKAKPGGLEHYAECDATQKLLPHV
ncbi:7393_t:CDS:2, partial [Funneliformis caledonium]